MLLLHPKRNSNGIGYLPNCYICLIMQLLAGTKIIEIGVHESEPCSGSSEIWYNHYHWVSHGCMYVMMGMYGDLLKWMLESVSLSFRMFSQTWSLTCAVSQAAVMMVVTACICMSAWSHLYCSLCHWVTYIVGTTCC